MSCYSDHNEDIRTKGSCDLCGGTEPERTDVELREQFVSELRSKYTDADLAQQLEWSKDHPGEVELIKAEIARRLPGDRPEEVGPSGTYGWRRVEPMSWEQGGAVLQVVEATNGRQWIATPARYYVYDVAQWAERAGGLAIDAGMGWHLPREDFGPLIAYARRVLAQ